LSNKKGDPLGVFDSGVGGLSVLRAIHQLLPEESLVYFGDQGHVPYGPRPMDEVRRFAEEITRFMLDKNAKLIVVACNTASAAALHYLRESFPEVPIVGMEPAIKPAAEITHTGVVGVLATPATFQGALYSSVVERFANHVKILQDTCPGLVQQIEKGDFTSDATRGILQAALKPMMKMGIDTIVLGCTHYPFVIPLIQEIVGLDVRVIDPSPSIARQVERLLVSFGTRTDQSQTIPMQFFTSGKAINFKRLLPKLFGETGIVNEVLWVNTTIQMKNSPGL
jgi:glutamate racemase